VTCARVQVHPYTFRNEYTSLLWTYSADPWKELYACFEEEQARITLLRCCFCGFRSISRGRQAPSVHKTAFACARSPHEATTPGSQIARVQSAAIVNGQRSGELSALAGACGCTDARACVLSCSMPRAQVDGLFTDFTNTAVAYNARIALGHAESVNYPTKPWNALTHPRALPPLLPLAKHSSRALSCCAGCVHCASAPETCCRHGAVLELSVIVPLTRTGAPYTQVACGKTPTHTRRATEST
jgi:hypothetical protein